MSVKLKDEFGNRMKGYESVETGDRFDASLPLYARIDGRGFSKFTQGMARPFDVDMSEAMISATAMLVERTNARMGYTQSDEISLVWALDSDEFEFFFAGKKQKMVSVLAALATAAFTSALLKSNLANYVERMPHFDARVFSLPNRGEAANAFLWREMDATKNAISMAAHANFSHKSLQGKSSRDKLALLHDAGVAFEDYPAFFTRGTFLRRVTEERTLTVDERMAIPEGNRPPENQTFLRSSVKTLDMPSFKTVSNREAVLFENASPIVNIAV